MHTVTIAGVTLVNCANKRFIADDPGFGIQGSRLYRDLSIPTRASNYRVICLSFYRAARSHHWPAPRLLSWNPKTLKTPKPEALRRFLRQNWLD